MRAARIGPALALAVATAGCGGPPGPPPQLQPGAPGTASELVERIESRVDSLETLKLGLEITWRDLTTGKRESCAGSLTFQAPGNLRLKGTTKAFFTVFEMVANDRETWLAIPREEQVIFGPRHDPDWRRLPLSPDHLLLALLVHPCPGEDCLESAPELTVDANRAVLTTEFWTLGTDSRTWLPTDYSDETGLRVEWGDWAVRRGVPWPHRIQIQAPGQDDLLVVTLGQLRWNPEVSPEVFQYELDDDLEVLSPADGARRWGFDDAGGASPTPSP